MHGEPLSSQATGAAARACSQPGLYGFAVEAEHTEPTLAERLTPAPAHWPRIRLRRTVEPTGLTGSGGPVEEVEMDDRRALVRLANGTVTMRRDSHEAWFRTENALSADELVHPMLGYAAVAFAYWLGRESFHAGVFLSGESAWALLGERGSGKSSTLGWLARNGQPIVADDMLFLDADTAFVGPRTIDLAGESAAHLGWGEELELVRRGFRRRLTLPSLAPEHRFAGWVSLAWGEELAVSSVPAAERIPLLIEHGHQPCGVANWGAILALASLPTFELRRPRRLESLSAAGELLLATTAAAG